VLKLKKKIINKFIRFRRVFTEAKVNVNRSMSYIALLNSGMILFLMLSKLQDYGFSVHITRWFIPIFVISMIAMIFIGYVDYRLGFHKEEARVSSSRNPYFEEIVERLDRVEKEIKRIKK